MSKKSIPEIILHKFGGMYGFFIILGFFFLTLSIIMSCLSHKSLYERDLDLGLTFIALGLASFSVKIAEESDKRMKTLGEAGIQDAIITLLTIRHRFFDDLYKYGKEYEVEEGDQEALAYKLKRLKDVTEWATWEQIRGIKKAVKFKENLDEEDKRDILRSHEILIDNIMKDDKLFFLLNRHPKQLLMGCKLLKEELLDLNAKGTNYEDRYIELFSPYLLSKHEREDFLSYINRNKNAVDDGTQPFQRLNQEE